MPSVGIVSLMATVTSTREWWEWLLDYYAVDGAFSAPALHATFASHPAMMGLWPPLDGTDRAVGDAVGAGVLVVVGYLGSGEALYRLAGDGGQMALDV